MLDGVQISIQNPIENIEQIINFIIEDAREVVAPLEEPDNIKQDGLITLSGMRNKNW